MTAATDLLTTMQEAGATIWAEGDRLKFQGLPARLIPAIRENKVALLGLLTSNPAPFAPLPSDQCPDEYARLERIAIQAESHTSPSPAPAMQHSPPMARQSVSDRVTCSACARFQPGPQLLSIGRCLATDNGLPPGPRLNDYRAAYPMAKRHCCEFTGVSS